MMEWIMAADPDRSDPAPALLERGEIDCRQNVFINTGDIVYLYIGGAAQCVRYQCEVTEQGIPAGQEAPGALAPESDANNRENYPHYMRLKLLCSYPDGLLPLEKLLESGLPNVKGTTLIRPKLAELLHSVS